MPFGIGGGWQACLTPPMLERHTEHRLTSSSKGEREKTESNQTQLLRSDSFYTIFSAIAIFLICLFTIVSTAHGATSVSGIGTDTLTITSDFSTYDRILNFFSPYDGISYGSESPMMSSPININQSSYSGLTSSSTPLLFIETNTGCGGLGLNYEDCLATGNSVGAGYYVEGGVWYEVGTGGGDLIFDFNFTNGYYDYSTILGCQSFANDGDPNENCTPILTQDYYATLERWNGQVYDDGIGPWRKGWNGGIFAGTTTIEQAKIDYFACVNDSECSGKEGLGGLYTISTDPEVMSTITWEEAFEQELTSPNVNISEVCAGETSCFMLFGHWQLGLKLTQFTFVGDEWVVTNSEYEASPTEPDPENPANTHIISLLNNHETFATSTPTFTLGGEIYVAESDFDPDLYVKFSFRRQSTTLATGASYETNNLLGEWSHEFNIETFGTTTYEIIVDNPENIGLYIYSAKIYDRDLFFDDQLAVLSGDFIVGEKNAYDKAIDQQREGLNNPNAFDIVEECSWTELSACMKGIIAWAFLPSPESTEKMGSLVTTLKTRFPFSYAFDMKNGIFTLFNTAESDIGGIGITYPGWEVEFLSKEIIASFPLSDEIKTLLTYALWFITGWALYRRTIKLFDNQTTS